MPKCVQVQSNQEGHHGGSTSLSAEMNQINMTKRLVLFAWRILRQKKMPWSSLVPTSFIPIVFRLGFKPIRIAPIVGLMFLFVPKLQIPGSNFVSYMYLLLVCFCGFR